MKGKVLDRAPTVEIEDAIVQLHGLMSAAHRKMLAFIAEFDRRCAWRRDGAASMEQWLCARVSVSYGTAVSWVAAAAKLDELPATATVFEQGGMSWDQMRFGAALRDAGAGRGGRARGARLVGGAGRSGCTP